MISYLLFINFSVNLILIGLIYTIQFIHYPLFKQVKSENFRNYLSWHGKKITPLVAPLMVLELTTNCLLLFLDLNFVHTLSLILVFAIWLSTFLIQVPIHQNLQKGYNEVLINRLVKSNWIRTILWTLKGTLLIWHIL